LSSARELLTLLPQAKHKDLHKFLRHAYNSIIDSAHIAGEQQLACSLYDEALQHKFLKHWSSSNGIFTASSNSSGGCLNFRYAQPGTAVVAVQCALRELGAAAALGSDCLTILTSEPTTEHSSNHGAVVRQSISAMLGELGIECSISGCEVTVPRSSLEAYLQQQTTRAIDGAELVI
jgi:hypothetical protein